MDIKKIIIQFKLKLIKGIQKKKGNMFNFIINVNRIKKSIIFKFKFLLEIIIVININLEKV